VSFVSPTVFIVATWLAAICGGVGVAAALVSAIVGYQLAEKSLQDSDVKIADANARQKEAELKLEQLRQLSGPRDLDFEVFKKEIEEKPKAPVAIWYLPDSSDGYWFASRLFTALNAAGWSAAFPVTIPDLDEQSVRAVVPDMPASLLPTLLSMPRAVSAGGQASGVTVVGDNSKADPNAGTPFAALFHALAKSTTFGMSSGASQFMPVPRGTLRVVVAAKTDPRFKDDEPVSDPATANPK
jgi:hypothetical protein